jgi:hypothetical protein
MSSISQSNWSINLILNFKILDVDFSIVEQIAKSSESQNSESEFKNSRIQFRFKINNDCKMKSNIKTSIISLISKNYHKWIKEIQNLTVRANVWKYVNFQDIKQKLTNEECFNVFDYVVSLKKNITIRQNSIFKIKSIRNFNKLFAAQKNSLKINIITWKLKKKRINKIVKKNANNKQRYQNLN